MSNAISQFKYPDEVLGKAIDKGDVTRVQLALDNHANPNGSYLGTPFIWLAASKGHIDIVEKLVARKVDVNVIHESESPLLAAIRRGHRMVADFLYKNGGKQIHEIDRVKEREDALDAGMRIMFTKMKW